MPCESPDSEAETTGGRQTESNSSMRPRKSAYRARSEVQQTVQESGQAEAASKDRIIGGQWDDRTFFGHDNVLHPANDSWFRRQAHLLLFSSSTSRTSRWEAGGPALNAIRIAIKCSFGASVAQRPSLKSHQGSTTQASVPLDRAS